MILAYPDPQPDTPVLPSHGPRWPLARSGDHCYVITDPATGQSRHFTRREDDLAELTAIKDRNGNRITFVYDDTGAPTEIVHSGGYRLKITTEQERITAIHLADGAPDGRHQELLRYSYTDGNLAAVTDSSGLPLQFTYDTMGRVTSWTDSNDRGYTYEYDDQDRCVAEGGDAGHMRLHLAYDDTDPATGHRVTSVITGEGHTRRYLINSEHQVVAEINPLGAVTRFERDRRNSLLSHTDPLGNTTSLSYDEAGNLATVTRPDGRRSSIEYNDLGRPVREVTASGATWLRTYDARGNRRAMVDPAGATTHFDHDEAGHLTAITDALGHTTTIRCDSAGMPTAITDPLGATMYYVRDAFGRPIAVTDSLGHTTHLEWTVEGKLVRRTAADGSTESWTYDGEGNCTSHTDPVGGASRFEYTHFDLLAARTDPDGARYTFAHDTELRVTQVTNPIGLTWAYEYDTVGRLISETDFDGRTLAYSHDAAGRLRSRTNALGQTVDFEYDTLGRVVCKDADGHTTTFTFSPADDLVEAAGPDATLSFQHDSLGNLTSESINGRTTTYAYDAMGRCTKRATPIGSTSTWAYDATGNPTRLTASGRTIDFDHDAAGRETSRHIGATWTLAHTFDELGRPTTQSIAKDGRTTQRRAYTYRADGYLQCLDDQLNGTRHFDLDMAGRVTAVRADSWTERYAYDTAGNQISASWPDTHPGQEAAGPRVYQGTRITRGGDVRYEFDAQGRITLRQKRRLSRKPDTWRYAWDAEDRLTFVITPDGTRWYYQYDPLGRRAAKQRLAADGEAVVERVDFTWDGATLCEQTTTAVSLPNPITLTWEHRDLHPIAQTERVTTAVTSQEEIDSRFFAIVTDLVGTPTELIDESGNISWRSRTTLWGTTTWNASATTYTPLRFPGQYFDPETGLHYNYFRHYDPETARYATRDPLGLVPAPNPVTYVHNPHTWTDPLGLAPGCGTEHPAVTETRDRMGDGSIVSQHPMTADEALDAAGGFLGDGYRELGRNRGVFRSADGLRQFRMDPDSMRGGHWPDIPHVHFEIFEAGGKKAVVNNHVPLIG